MCWGRVLTPEALSLNFYITGFWDVGGSLNRGWGNRRAPRSLRTAPVYHQCRGISMFSFLKFVVVNVYEIDGSPFTGEQTEVLRGQMALLCPIVGEQENWDPTLFSCKLS